MIDNKLSEILSKTTKINDRVYKTDDKLYYLIKTNYDKVEYMTRNESLFLGTEPITISDHYEIQKLMIKEKRAICIVCIIYQDIDNMIDMITCDKDELMYRYLYHINS